MNFRFTRSYFLILLALLGFGSMLQAQVFWTEDFGLDNNCVNQAQNANGVVTANGAWSVNSAVGVNDPSANEFFISATEAGMGAGACGDGCLANASLTNQSLHVANVSTSPAAFLFCPTGDCGAAYDAGPATAKRAESPTIDCSGQAGITVDFIYMTNGEIGADESSLWYFDGAAWSALQNPLVPTVGCGGGQGQWTAAPGYALPASADNNPNVKIGFQWVNNNNNSGSDPSFAVDDVTLTATTSNPIPTAAFTISNTTLCEGDCIDFTDISTGSPTGWGWSFPGAATAVSTAQNPTGICYPTAGTYDVTLAATNANGFDDTTMVAVITVTACNAPTAAFSSNLQNICEGDCIDFSDLSTGNPTSWNWTFPGATTGTSTAQNPTGICYAAAGTYDVTLSVTNASGTDVTTTTGYITVTACTTPTAAFSSNNQNICEGDCINFTDLSTGTPTSWNWTFPGATTGTSTAQNPTGICYPTAGTYDVTLSVTNANGTDATTTTGYITVTVCGGAPVANFTASSTNLCAGDCIDFADATTGAPSSWNWTFPGGTPSSSTAQNPAGVCYNTPGTYDVTLSATNAFGTDNVTITGMITVTACATPTASFTVVSNNICEGDCIDFMNTSTGGTSYAWTFSGGTPATSTDQDPTGICFGNAGSYDVTLTTTNAAGSDTYTETIVVGAPPILDAGIDQTVGLGDSVILSVTGGSGSCVWSPASSVTCPTCPTTGALPITSTMYTVTCIDTMGCVSSANVNVIVIGEEGVGVPTAFSPDGNGNNDVLYVEGQGISTMRFVVYNRYGQKIFESIDINEGWDGTFKGKQLNPGVFAWYLEVEFFSGNIERLKGNTTLMH